MLALTATALLGLHMPTNLPGASQGEKELLTRFGLPNEPKLNTMATSRRSLLNSAAAAAVAMPLLGSSSPVLADGGMFSLPPLPYAYVRSPRAPSPPAHLRHRSPTPACLSALSPPAALFVISGRSRAAH